MPTLKHLSTRLRPWRILIAMLLAVILLIGWMLSRGKEVELRSASRQAIAQTLIATGRVETPAQVQLGLPVAGIVETLAAREGSVVKQGELLIALRADEARASLAAADAAVVEARARLAQVAQVAGPVSSQQQRQAEENLRVAQLEYQRVEALIAQGFVSPSRRDDARRTLQNAEAALAAARSQAAANQPAGSEMAAAASRLAQAEANLRAARARMANHELRAPADGTVLSREVNVGDITQAGRVLMRFAAGGTLRIVTQMDEKHLARLKPGVAGKAIADAYPGQPFDVVIDYVAPGVDAQRGTVEVKFSVPQPPAFLRPDMTVSVEIVVARKDSAVVLPLDAIHAPEGDSPWVLRVREGRAERVAVTLGVRGMGAAEIAKGLDAGELVVAASEPTQPGERVRGKPQRKAGLQGAPGLTR
ncbi:efflux RND transporter periplasmic adaptor subunit [Niveibacterium sp.]|uniref:efflux RND transporter periplasmic adaptor subunit n=1 Tax=Niveibacterium sp. TaxID=2017444 RepID=UPI0035B4BB8F